MTKALIVLDDLYLKTESTLETAVTLKETQDEVFFITNRDDVTEYTIIPLTENTVKDFLQLRDQVEDAEELVFVITPNQYAFVKFLAIKVFGESRPITYEYVPVNVRGYEYTGSINQYVDRMVSYIQKLDSVEDGNLKELIAVA